MPTLIEIDSFQHQVLRVSITAGANAWYALVTDTGTTNPSHGGGNITFDTSIKRTADHVCSLKMAYLAARGIQVRNTIVAGTRDANVSFYFRTVDATNPSTSATVLFAFGASTENSTIGINTSGQITAKAGAGGTVQNGSVDVCDGAWHRIDARCVTSGATFTLDVQVDGTALTQATDPATAADITDWNFGLTTGTVDYTIYYSDFVMSATGADYPMGDHICKMLEINGTGTHGPGAGAFTDQAGGTSDAALLAACDDAWDGTTPELSQTGEDYVQQTANDSIGYVEFTLEDPTESAIWNRVQLGTLMASEDATTANNCVTQLVDSGGTTLATTGLVDPSVSATVYTGYRPMAIVDPGAGWSGTTLSGCKVRFGFSTDAAPDALFNSAIVEYASPWSAAPAVDIPPRPTIVNHAVTRSHSY